MCFNEVSSLLLACGAQKLSEKTLCMFMITRYIVVFTLAFCQVAAQKVNNRMFVRLKTEKAILEGLLDETLVDRVLQRMD